jgi:hypothetical protein
MTTSFLVKATLAAAATMLTLTPALADQVDKRQHKQAQRIEHGVKTGQLTKHEAAKLKAEQNRIAAMERRFERDGHLSRGERAYLNYQQNRASKHIRAEKHDGKKSWWKRSYSWDYGNKPNRRWY